MNDPGKLPRRGRRGSHLRSGGTSTHFTQHWQGLEPLEPRLLLSGTISGTVWADLNADGMRDAGEPGISGTIIYLDDDDSGQLDWTDADGDLRWDQGEGERWVLSAEDDPATAEVDETGRYLFDGLGGGEYIVAHLAPLGYGQTYPLGDLIFLGSAKQAGAPMLDGAILGATLTTTGSSAPVYAPGEIVDPEGLVLQTVQSGSLIDLDLFRADPFFAGIDGAGYAVAVLDTGIDLNHPFFGLDADSNGIADRIIYQADFTSTDGSAQDGNGHGSNVSSIVGSSDATWSGMAPGVDIVALQVLDTAGSGTFGQIEQALQWLVTHAATYNIVAINMSLSDQTNHTFESSLYGLGDEQAALEALGVIVVSAAGNSFYSSSSVPGEGYPASDPAGISVGAVYDSSIGSVSYSSGATAYSTGADRLARFPSATRT
ncbi:MAG: S8 family serine peptidase [Phycisphaeraceae bacterium]